MSAAEVRLLSDCCATSLAEHCVHLANPCNGAVVMVKARAFRVLVGVAPEILVEGNAWVRGKAPDFWGRSLRLYNDPVRKVTRDTITVWDREAKKEERVRFTDIKDLYVKLVHPESDRKVRAIR
jgi:hypothetical protein